MASHEIELTASELDRENGFMAGDNSPVKTGVDEHSPTALSKDDSDSSLNSNEKEIRSQFLCGIGDEDEIHYHYLTFETELPQPTSISPSEPGAPQPPPTPDLTKYTSPFLWSKFQKGIIIWLSVIATSFTAFSAGAYSPGLEQMSEHWNVGHVALLTGITTFTTGFGVAPMVLAPFSEINGRVSHSYQHLEIHSN